MKKLLLALLLLSASAVAQTNSMTIQEMDNTTTANYPVSFARPFRIGEITDCPRPVIDGTPATAWQVDEKRTHAGGSFEWGIISFLIPSLVANSTVTITFTNAACSNTPLATTVMDDVGYDFDAIFELTPPTGTACIISARDMLLADDYTVWASGAVAQTIILIDYLDKTYDCGWKDKRITTLAGTAILSSSATTVPVTDATHIAALALPTVVQIDLEEMNVTAVVANNLTVTRAFNGTNAASHGTGVTVTSLSQATEWVDAPSDIYKSFRPMVQATFWPTINKVKVEFIGENSDTTRLQNLVYSLVLKTGDASPTTVYSENNITHYARSRWFRPVALENLGEYWIGGDPPEIRIDHNSPYLISTNAIPNYDLSIVMNEDDVSDEYLQNWLGTPPSPARDRSIGGGGPLKKSMPGSGARPDVGLHPAWAARYFNSYDNRMWEMMHGSTRLGGGWQIHMREGADGLFYDRAASVNAKGKWFSVNARPTVYLLAGLNATNANIVTAHKIRPVGALSHGTAAGDGWDFDEAHQPDLFFVPYLLTGNFWYLEQMIAWQHATSAYSNPGSGVLGRGPGATATLSGTRGRIAGQVRANAWNLRNRVYTLYSLSDTMTDENTHLQFLLDDALAMWEGARGITGTAYEGNEAYNWGVSVLRDWTFDIGGIATHYGLPPAAVPIWQSGNIGFVQSPMLVPPNNTACGGQSSWEMYFVTASLKRAQELGFTATTALLEWIAPAIINSMTDGTFDPRIPLVGNGRYASIKCSTNTWYQSWTDMASAFDPAFNYTSGLEGQLQAPEDGKPYRQIPANAAVADLSAAGAAAWAWTATNVMTRVELKVNPKWAILPRDLATGPVISSVFVDNITPTSVRVNAMTDVAATCTVHYGLTAGYGSTQVGLTLVTNHTGANGIVLTGLTASTLYHYKIACVDGTSNPGETGDGTFTTASTTKILAVYSGNNQTGTVSADLAAALTVVVVDDMEVPLSGETISWTSDTGGGTITPSSNMTDGDGRASATATCSSTAGVHTWRGTLSGGSPGFVTFTSNCEAAIITQPTIQKMFGRLQVLVSKSTVLQGYATLDDGPVEGRTIDVAVTSGTGTVSPSAVTTKVDGKFAATFTCPAGAESDTVTFSNADDTSIFSFAISCVAAAGAATTIRAYPGLFLESRQAGNQLMRPFCVRVVDSADKGVTGTSVTWAVTAGGGSLTVSSGTTNSDGQLCTQLTLGGVAGSNTVTATSAGLTGSPVTFTATGL